MVIVENNFSGQFARHLRAETGIGADHVVTKYDGEPFEPAWIARRIRDFVEGRAVDLTVEEHEAREMAYHYIRIYMQDKTRPGRLERVSRPGYDERVWEVELVDRAAGRAEGMLVIGADSGSMYSFHPLAPRQQRAV